MEAQRDEDRIKVVRWDNTMVVNQYNGREATRWWWDCTMVWIRVVWYSRVWMKGVTEEGCCAGRAQMGGRVGCEQGRVWWRRTGSHGVVEQGVESVSHPLRVAR